jgi:hypothetical protein
MNKIILPIVAFFASLALAFIFGFKYGFEKESIWELTDINERKDIKIVWYRDKITGEKMPNGILIYLHNGNHIMDISFEDGAVDIVNIKNTPILDKMDLSVKHKNMTTVLTSNDVAYVAFPDRKVWVKKEK